MAKKSAKSDRQAVIDEIRRKQKGADRKRGWAIVGVCVTIALLLVGAAAYSPVKSWYDLRKFNDLQLSDIGSPASSCKEIVTKKAEGSSDHVTTGTSVEYEEAPPAFGQHWNEAGEAPAPMDRKFYSADDRPELESLVHNLEHGYTVLWYDETAAEDDDMMTVVEALADKFRSDPDNWRSKFIAAPWTSDDGDGKDFPGEAHIAFSHWSAGGSGETDVEKQLGVWQYCSEPSGEALEKFMLDYPYTDSPEPNAL